MAGIPQWFVVGVVGLVVYVVAMWFTRRMPFVRRSPSRRYSYVFDQCFAAGMMIEALVGIVRYGLLLRDGGADVRWQIVFHALWALCIAFVYLTNPRDGDGGPPKRKRRAWPRIRVPALRKHALAPA